MRIKRISLLTTIFVVLGLSSFSFYKFYWTDDYRLFSQSMDKYQEANRLFEEHKYEKAKNITSNLKEKYVHNEYISLINLLQGKIEYHNGNYETSLNLLGQSKSHLSNYNDDKLTNVNQYLYEISIYQAMNLAKLKEYELSNSILTKYNNDYKNINNIPKEDMIFHYINNSIQLSQYDDDMEEKLNTLIHNEDDKQRLTAYFDSLTDYYIGSGNEDELQYHYYKAVSETENIKYMVDALQLFINKNKYEEAHSFIETNRYLIDTSSDYYNELMVYIGIIEYGSGNNQNALDVFEQIENEISETQKIYSLLQIYKLYIYYENNNYLDAYKTALKIEKIDNLDSSIKQSVEEYKLKIKEYISF